MPRPEFELKQSLRHAKLPLREVADRLETPYGTLAGWLNGFAPLPVEARREIMQMIDAEKMKAKSIP